LPFEKWEDPEFIEQYDKKMRIRESEKLPIRSGSEVTIEPTVWIFQNWVAQGELTLLAGAPNSGKTALACALAAGVTRGKAFPVGPGLNSTGSGHVIFLTTEDSEASTIKPRLIASGADEDRFHFINSQYSLENETPFSFVNQRDMNRLAGWCERFNNNLGLIVIDPVSMAVDGDPSNNYKARQAYERLSSLSKRLSCGILGITHTVTNTRGKDLLARVAGPRAIREVPRTLIYLTELQNGPTENGGTHIFLHAKNNIGTMCGGFEYYFPKTESSEGSRPMKISALKITGELLGDTADLVAEYEGRSSSERVSKKDFAKNFLINTLTGKSLLWIEIEALSVKEGISKGTLMLAKSELKILPKKREGDGRSVWSLPNNKPEANGVSNPK